jgi:P pilus assembly chaperone PapD
MINNFNFFFKRFLSVTLIFFFLEESVYAIKISPVVLDINKEKKIVTLSFTNDTGNDINIQSSALTWTQAGGEDKYSPTNDLVIIPAIVSIPAGKVQTFRISKRVIDNNPLEQAYRVYLQDVSPDFVDPNNPTGVAFKFNQDLPAFYFSGKQVYDKKFFNASICKSANPKTMCVRIENTGDFRLSLRGVKAKSLEGKIQDDFDLGIAGTILAKSSKEFTFNTPEKPFKNIEINSTLGSIIISTKP